jgi:hypothetical protein
MGDDQTEHGPSGPEVALRDARQAVLESMGARFGQERSRFGMYLSQHEGRIVSGRKFIRGGKRGGARKWRVARVRNASATVQDLGREAGGQ